MKKSTARLALFVLSAGAFAPALNAQSFTVAGSIASKCQIGSSTSYAVSIVVTAGSGANRTFQISLDSAAGNSASGNNSVTTTSGSYATFCNSGTSKALAIAVPQATSGANTLNYTIVVKDQNAAQLGTATSPTGGTATVPAGATANYTITASATNANNTPVGTYNATVTIQ